MIDGYKKIMDNIKTDEQFKSEFIKNLENKKQKRSILRFVPKLAYAASAAALAVVVYCTSLFFSKQPQGIGVKITDEFQPAQTEQISVAYFTFDGFEQFDVNLESRAFLISEEQKRYTVTELLDNWYALLSNDSGEMLVDNGLVKEFANVHVDDAKEINVYINDRELVNIDTAVVADCVDDEYNVYFKVSVVE